MDKVALHTNSKIQLFINLLKTEAMTTKRILVGSLALTKLQHAVIQVKNKKGDLVEGVFLPIDHNYFVKGSAGALYMPFRVVMHQEPDEYGQHGFIAQAMDSKMWKTMPEDQRSEVTDNMPILGNLKDVDSLKQGSGKMQEISEDQITNADDLPF